MKIQKKALRLKEDSNSMSSTEKIQTAVNNAKNNVSGKDTESLSDIDNNNATSAPEIRLNANSSTAVQDAQQIANKAASTPSMKGATITFEEGKEKKKPIKESVQFTKGEISAFLRSL